MKRKQKNSKRFILLVVMLCLWAFPIVSYAETLEQITYEGPVFTEDQEPEVPSEHMEQGGKRYQLISVELVDAKKRGTITYVSSTIPYELEGMQTAPETAVLTIKDEATGNHFEREVPRKEIMEKDMVWKDDFSFPITVFGYGADVFYLGDHEVPANADLAQYGEQLLEYLGLPMECYMVDEVEWSGEPYEQDGMICRNAVAYGKKLVRYVDVVYGGQVQAPDVPGKQYVAVYEEILPETISETETTTEIEETETMAEAEPENENQLEESFADRIMRWVKEHITVVVFTSVFLLLALGWGFLLFLSTKKKKEKAGD